MKDTSNISTTLQSITYSNGPVVSNNKLFRKIKVEGSAYIPQGRSVELRALEEIEMDPDFEAPTGTDFLAEIVADSGMYQYDAIGNLVLDQHEGVKIYWTPYGKVREVRAKNDSLITTFRYDGTGNRIEKRVRSLSSGEGWGEAVTHYVRDASGNVMGVYKDSIVSEHHLYGSSRLGMYTGGRYNGQLSLGEKNYELSNHLSNVLTTITDNIGMIEGDSTWATVVSTRDYYPFGLEMGGRSWSDTTWTYRYGFNGKEKDDKGEWGNVAYDYGFRIYDPTIAKFLSVDPLTTSYPWYTPYQFSGNKPIWAIDLDGLEEKKVTIIWENAGQWSPGHRKVIVPENATAVSVALSTAEQYRLAVRRFFEPGQHYLPENQYVDENFMRVEFQVREFFSNNAPKYSPSSTASNIVHAATLFGVLSGDAELNSQAIEQIQRIESFIWNVPLTDFIGGSGGAKVTFSEAIKSKQNALEIIENIGRRSAKLLQEGFGKNWAKADLLKTLEKIGYTKIEFTETGKVLWKNEKTGIQLVQDPANRYFRIEDTNLSGKRRYLDLQGEVPNNKKVDGRTIGNSQAEYNELTHFTY